MEDTQTPEEEYKDPDLCGCGEYLKITNAGICFRCERRDFSNNQKPVKKVKKSSKKK